jgi:hypothetical protein
MRGSLWGLVVVGVGGAVMLRGAGVATPSSTADSTDSVVSVLQQLTPFAGSLLAVAALAILIIYAVRAT